MTPATAHIHRALAIDARDAAAEVDKHLDDLLKACLAEKSEDTGELRCVTHALDALGALNAALLAHRKYLEMAS